MSSGVSKFLPAVPRVEGGCVLANGVTISRRELDVLEELTCGDGDALMADRLGIAVSTVRGHLNRLKAKTELNRTQLAILKAELDARPHVPRRAALSPGTRPPRRRPRPARVAVPPRTTLAPSNTSRLDQSTEQRFGRFGEPTTPRS